MTCPDPVKVKYEVGPFGYDSSGAFHGNLGVGGWRIQHDGNWDWWIDLYFVEYDSDSGWSVSLPLSLGPSQGTLTYGFDVGEFSVTVKDVTPFGTFSLEISDESCPSDPPPPLNPVYPWSYNPNQEGSPWGGDPHGPHPALRDGDPIVSSCPLILDLDGDGVEADSVIYFDHEGDGFAELSAWAGEDDGTLVWDRNNDGVINDGSELFGNNTVLQNGNKAANGFAALADLDSNGDGVVDASDTNWANLKVLRWTDSDGDGVKDTLELSGLADLDIESLNTVFTNSNHVDSSGNEHRQVGSYTKADGTTATMTDVWFQSNKRIAFYSRDGMPTRSAMVEALPEAAGNGRVYNLRDAMALDDATDANGDSQLTAPYYSNNRTETRSLREMVEAFTATNADGSPNLDKTAREALATKILHRWAGAGNLDIPLNYGILGRNNESKRA